MKRREIVTAIVEHGRTGVEEHRVGKYVADYSELSPEQLSDSVPEMDDLIRRSTSRQTGALGG